MNSELRDLICLAVNKAMEKIIVVENITVETRLKEDLGIDSLGTLMVLFYIKEEVGVRESSFRPDEWIMENRINTVGDIVKVIKDYGEKQYA